MNYLTCMKEKKVQEGQNSSVITHDYQKGSSIADLAKDAGEAVNKGLNAINPMNWGW
ncbi:hypothetical protein ACM26V_04200 [Salipaludibacillus sp. HK11]|uniref:hypothetical protein n=1 Tax=Salipaludibacillus sp. HK11 TaxID=3394320 RepID=UPI0039FD20EE